MDATASEHPSSASRIQSSMAEIAARVAGSSAQPAALEAVATVLEQLRDTLASYPNSTTLWGHITRGEPESAGILALGVSGIPITTLSAGVMKDAVAGTVTLQPHHAGPEGAAHGGVIATLFDELLAQLHPLMASSQVRTAWLRVEYRAPVPLAEPLALTGTISNQEGRAIEASGELRAGGGLLARAEGRFVALR